MSSIENRNEITNFFEKISEQDEYSKITINGIKDVIEGSKFPDSIKDQLYDKVELHSSCEYDDLEVDSFVVSTYGGSSYVLECECCCGVIISSSILEQMLES